MSLYVRHSAWLNATLERPENDKSKAPQLSRIEKMRKQRKDEDWQPDMPPVEVCGHLIGFLFEVGPTTPGGAGPSIITWGEIDSWQSRTGLTLKPWEALFLRRLSAEYLRESREAEKPDRSAPWKQDEVPTEQLNAVADSMRDAMRRRAAK